MGEYVVLSPDTFFSGELMASSCLTPAAVSWLKEGRREGGRSEYRSAYISMMLFPLFPSLSPSFPTLKGKKCPAGSTLYS